MEEKFQLLKVREFTDVINDAIAFTKRYIKPIGYCILVLVVPLYLIGSFFYSDSLSNAFNFGRTSAMHNYNRFAMGSVLGLLLIAIGGMLLNVIFISAFINVENSEEGELDSKSIFSNLMSNLGRLLGFYFLVFFIIMVVGSIVVLIIAAMASAAATGVMVLLFIILFPLTVYLAVCLSFTPIIYIRERCGFGAAISRSFYLIKNNWWWTFLILVVGWLLGAMAGFIFQVPYLAIAWTKALTSISSGHTGYNVSILDRVAMMLSNFGGIVTTTVVTLVNFVQYYSLVEKKDGVSLMDQIDSIGANENSSY